MKIPLAFSDIGYFVNFGHSNYYYFVLEVTNNMTCYEKFRKGTWAEFKKLYPYTVYNNGSCCCYRKLKNK